MDKNVNDLLMIDQEIGEFFYESNGLSNEKINEEFNKRKYIDKALKKFSKLSNKNVLEVLKRSQYLIRFIDIKKFIKKYPLNKTLLKRNTDLYFDEYMNLKNTCLYISNVVNNYSEFKEYMDILDVDNVEYYLLENMSNNQIYRLSNETGDWSQKLYYFSFLKQND